MTRRTSSNSAQLDPCLFDRSVGYVAYLLPEPSGANTSGHGDRLCVEVIRGCVRICQFGGDPTLDGAGVKYMQWSPPAARCAVGNLTHRYVL